MPEIGRGIGVPVPPPATFPDRFFKLPRVSQKPLQKRILEYLNEGRKASIHAVSEDLGVSRFSARRCLTAMKGRGSVKDQPEFFARSVVPGILAHGFSITDLGKKELKFLQSTANPVEPIPLGWRILLYMSHENVMTTGQIAKMCGKDRGHVKRVVQSLQNKGLVDCLLSSTCTTFGLDAITHFWRITGLGKRIADAGPDMYVTTIRSRTKRRAFWERP
jgi:Mn-dependent DtxR family transcriptional regulator